jgi:hypothetical protein
VVNAEELIRRLKQHPTYKAQREEFIRISEETPCAVCGDETHNAHDGHPRVDWVER